MTEKVEEKVEAVAKPKVRKYDGKFVSLPDLSLTQKTETIKRKEEDGTVTQLGDVTFNFPGMYEMVEITDKLQTSYAQYADALLKKIVAAPVELRQNGLDFFNTHDGMAEVLAAADTFLNKVSDRVPD
jgi:hypothetical protein